MRRAAAAAAWLALIVLTAFGPFWLAGETVSREELVRDKYDSWTGVLRLWKCEGWESGSGSLTTWLSGCVDAFEKNHPGTYIQITDVSEETLRSFVNGNVNPPDMLLYAPGMLDAPFSLAQMNGSLPIKASLMSMGVWEEARYAAPIALGGYAMAIRSDMIPDTLSDWGEMTPVQGSGKKKPIYALDVPCDGDWMSWSAALITLFSGSVQPVRSETRAGEGMDLGLEVIEAGEAEDAEGKTEQIGKNTLPRNLSERFGMSESVFDQFAAGEIAAMPTTQRGIRRLQLLAESGRAIDWRAECMGVPFTDQAALYSIVAWPREDMTERRALAEAFLNLLLSQEMQRKLTVARAFPAIETADLYPGIPGMNGLEAALNRPDLMLPPAFGKEWRAYAETLADGLRAGEDTQEACRLLESMLRGEG